MILPPFTGADCESEWGEWRVNATFNCHQNAISICVIERWKAGTPISPGFSGLFSLFSIALSKVCIQAMVWPDLMHTLDSARVEMNAYFRQCES